ncbi:hypothetical protein GCM10009641_47000 [Mycobacterium cookii]
MRGTRRLAKRVAVATLLTIGIYGVNGCDDPESPVMPDVTGMRLERALTVLARNEIETQNNYKNAYGAARVIATDPAPGQPTSWDRVGLTLSRITVTRVRNGSTLDLSTGDRVRLIGVSTPKDGDCGAAEAKKYLVSTVMNAPVLVENPTEVEDRDDHGRLLVYIGTPVINDVGYQLMRRGLATPPDSWFDRYASHPSRAVYAEASKEAKKFTCRPTPERYPPPSKPPSTPEPYPVPSTPAPTPRWVCYYAPTYDGDWHNDVLCSNGVNSERPYLRAWDSFVTEAEARQSGREYERQLNEG